MAEEKILVIDDEPMVLDLCRRILTAEGYHVATAGSGWEGIERLRDEGDVDLVLTDIKMPGLDGLETLQILRDSHPDLVTVVMTGFSTMDLAIQAIKLGVDEFIVKPFTPPELSLAVSRALEKVRLRRENIRLQAIVPLFELSQTFLRTVESGPLMDQVAQTARRESRADRAVLLLAAAPKSTYLAVKASAGYGPAEAEALAQQEFAREAILPSSTQWLVPSPEAHEGRFRPLLQALGLSSAIITPLAVKEGTLGALVVGWAAPTGSFPPGHAEFLAVLGSQAAIALDNARLFEDIQRAYRELQALDRLKSEFINIAAHELRTPIAILMGYASLLEETAPEDLREPLAVMVRNAERLSSLVDDLLNLERLQAGAALLTVETVALAEVVAEVVADFRPLAESKSLHLEAEVQEGLPPIQTDRSKVHLVVANLVSNAVKFTLEGGQVTVRAFADKAGEGLVLEVQDTGIGIPPEEQERIFQPFYQVGSSLTRRHEGMGLGLSIVKGMLNLLGGTVSVESQVGKGSTFRVRLPAQPPAKQGQGTPYPYLGNASNSRTVR
ncbi:MAG: ATP-binding protein [Anaerolineae bacterium]